MPAAATDRPIGVAEYESKVVTPNTQTTAAESNSSSSEAIAPIARQRERCLSRARGSHCSPVATRTRTIALSRTRHARRPEQHTTSDESEVLVL